MASTDMGPDMAAAPGPVNVSRTSICAAAGASASSKFRVIHCLSPQGTVGESSSARFRVQLD